MHSSRTIICAAVLTAFACKGPTEDPDPILPNAVVEADRSGHWLDRPFPSDELLRADGTADWTVVPEAPSALGTTVVSGWAQAASAASQGFSHQPACYFRFDGPLDLDMGDVGITGVDGSEIPVEWLWIDDPAGDPFLAENLLIVMPQPTAPLRSGERYVAWVSSRVANRAKGWSPPEEAPAEVAVSTTFTVQPSLGQMISLLEAADAFVDATPSMLEPTEWRRVLSLSYEPGQTASGQPSAVATVTYEDGQTSETYLADEGHPAHTVDLSSWSHEVWEGRIETVAFQDEEGRPWASPGVGLVGDFDRVDEGWIAFDGTTLISEGRSESMRIVVQIPKTPGPHPVITWDHGTGGHAYSAVQRVNPEDRGSEVAAAMAEAVVVSRDQPLDGQRYALIDAGFDASIGLYNIGNLVAFRDNQRQAAVDHRVLHRFVEDALPALADIDLDRIGAFGHSLGSVTAHGGLAGQQGRGASSAFLSGAGGYLAYYVLESGLLGGDNDVVTTMAPLLGLTPADLADTTPAELTGALIGLPESAWPNVGRHHPLIQIFGTIMDPSDPVMFAADQVIPETILLGLGDLQVPENTTRWLAEITPDATLIDCEPLGDYDGHLCLFREDAGLQALEDWALSL